MIKINDKEYVGTWIEAQDGTAYMKFNTSMSVVEIDTEFSVGTSPTIDVFEGGSLARRYYNKGVNALRIEKKSDYNIAEVNFSVTKISESTEEELQIEINDNTDGIIDLADWIQGLDDRITVLENLYSELNDRVTALEERNTETEEPEQQEESEEINDEQNGEEEIVNEENTEE